MKELRLMVIDCRNRMLECSVETYLNSKLEEIQAFHSVSNVSLHSVPAPDYFVFSYQLQIGKEGSSGLEEFLPP